MADWRKTKKPMLGQLFDEGSMKRWGSVFQNEMEFHIRTKGKDGFCELCDLKPTFESPGEGFTQPGRLFHSRANEFKASTFPDWICETLFVEEENLSSNSCVVVLGKKGVANEAQLEIPSSHQLSLLAGIEGECQGYRDLLTSTDSQVTLRFVQYTSYSEIKNLPPEFEPYLGDVSSCPLPSLFVPKVHYGWAVYLRFESRCNNVKTLIAQVKLLGNCLKGNKESSFLDQLPPCWIRGYLGSQWEEHKSFNLNSFRATFDAITKATKKLEENKFKGIAIDCYSQNLNKFDKQKFGPGQDSLQLELLERIKRSPSIIRNDIEEKEITPHKPFKLWAQIENLKNKLRRYDRPQITELRREFEIFLQAFQDRLAAKMSDYRFGIDENYSLKTILDDFLKAQYSPKVKKCLNKIEIERMIEELKMKGAVVLPLGYVEGEHVILQFHPEHNDTCVKNFELFMRLLVKRKIESRPIENFYLNQSPDQSQTLIKHMRGDQTISNDLLGDLRNRPIWYKTTLTSEYLLPVSNFNGRLLSFPCPFSWSGGCPPHHNRWSCEVCKSIFRYHPSSESVSCQCGLLPFNRLGAICQHPKHPIMPTSLKQYETKSPRGELICILIGATGSGKSTLINSLANYLSYASFEEATERKPTHVLIPTAYSKVTEDEIEVIPVGQNSNEKVVEGYTHTLQPRSYCFRLDPDTFLRVVDTSGFLKDDPAQGQVETVLELIGQYREVHSLCFVINSNNEKPSEALRTIYQRTKEALKCTENFIFIFTNFRTEPVPVRFVQEVKNTIIQEIHPENLFKLDNRAFQYILSKGESKSLADKIAAEDSWSSSLYECDKIIKRLHEIRPFSLPCDAIPPLDPIPPEDVNFNVQPFGSDPRATHNVSTKVMCDLTQKLKLSSAGWAEGLN